MDPVTQSLQLANQQLEQERQRNQAQQAQLLKMSQELEVLRGAASHANNSRMLAEEELADTHDRLQLALDAAQLALWEWNTRSGDVYLNARWAEMMGDVMMEGHCPITDLVAHIHPDEAKHIRSQLGEALHGRLHRFTLQYRTRTTDGDWMWVENQGMVAEQDPAGRALRVIGIIADIQERKQLQHEAEQGRIQAEAASKAKSEFLANVSHEIRTPLNGIIGLMRMMSDSPLDAQQQSWLGHMGDSASALLGLINGTLDLSQLQSGQMQLQPKPFHLARVLQDLCAPLQAMAASKAQAFEVRVQPNLPGHVFGDAHRLQQVLHNLLSNAIKFTPKQGRIELGIGTATATGLEHRIRFEVSDTGIGIAPEHHQKIFESFTQLDASNTRKHGGTGLGLSIASQLVSMMGGHLQVQSDLGLGSRFSFDVYLPASSDDSTADNAYPSQTIPMEFEQLNAHANRFNGLNVLLAEDHHVNEILMSQMLLVFGCSIAIAHNGLEAVAAWKRGGIDLILMDVQMPELNGLDATIEIRNLEAGRQHHTPIVAVTANAMAGDREQCLAAGMDDYVPKPVNPGVLIQAMANALNVAKGQEAIGTSTVRPVKPVVIAPKAASADGVPPDKLLIAPTRTPLNQSPALDLDKLRHRMGNDAQALSQLAAAMRNDMSIHLAGLEVAFENEDRSSACMHAHSLKGSLASMTAQKAANLSNGLELAAKTAEWSLFSRSLPLLKLEIQKVDAVLQTLL